MPVIACTPNTSITRKCYCGAESVHVLADLLLGIGGPRPNVDAILLPDCVSCGAREFLSRTWDSCPAQYIGRQFDLQRRAVNSFAQQLKAGGRSHADCAAAHTAESGSPPDQLPSISNTVTIPFPGGG